MSATPDLFGPFLLAGVLGELRNRTAHEHNRSMNARRCRDGA